MLVRAAVPSGNEALDPCSKRTTGTMQSVNLERRLAYLLSEANGGFPILIRARPRCWSKACDPFGHMRGN